MIPAPVSPALASACAVGVSDARLALLLARGIVVVRMTVLLPRQYERKPRRRFRLPGAPFEAGLGQGRRLEEGGIAGEVQRIQWRIGRGVPRGERGQVPFLLDQPEYRGVVEHLGADVDGPRAR